MPRFFVVLAGSPTGRSSSQSVVPPQRKCPGTNAVAFFAWKTNRQIANMALGLRTLSVFASVCSHVMFVGSVPTSVIGCAFYWTICIFCRLVIYEDLTSRRHRNDGECIGNHPQMAAFQLFSGRWSIFLQPDILYPFFSRYSTREVIAWPSGLVCVKQSPSATQVDIFPNGPTCESAIWVFCLIK